MTVIIKNRCRNTSVLCILMAIQVNALAAPQDEGSWSAVADWPTIAIHSVLTPQGNVMNFGTDENGIQGAQFFYDVWNPELGTGANSHTTSPNTLGVDSFCSAAVLLPETGNILMSGGDNRPNGGTNRGINDAPIYNTQTNSLSRAADMNSARWYPTSTVLANGDILLNGGIDSAGRTVTTPEVYSPATNQWRSLLGISTAGYGYPYPRQWLAPNGKVFGYTSNKKMYYMDTNGNGSLQALGTINVVGNPYLAAAVMYRPGKILQVGGRGNITNDAKVIDINGATPVVRDVTKPSQAGRVWVESVVLPNGKVMIVGGSAQDNALVGTALRPEIWDPATEAWTLMETAVRARLYHSTSLLLKDGRILVAGGGAPGPQVNTNAEIFTPPYLYNNSGQLAARPTIVSAPDEAPYGSNVAVRHDPTDIISRATLIKTGATTHSNNMEQRFIELDFTDIHNGVSVTLPSTANIAPPGYYLLHLLDNKGVPSEAHIIRISSTAELEIGPYPVALADTGESILGAAITLDVLANDTANGKGLVDVNQYSEQGGTAQINAGKIVYTPKPEFSGADSFWYVMEDDQGRTNAAKVTVSVTATDVYPTATPDDVDVAAGSSITIDVLANDLGSGLVLTAPNVWSLKGGNVSLVDNKLVYTPKAGFTGSDNIWYVFNDFQNRSNSGQVNITVINSAFPEANPDNDTTPRNTAKTLDILANDTPSGDVSIDNLYAYTAKGGTTTEVDGKVLYTPKADFTGEDNFWYVMVDSLGRKNSAQVKINVTP
ncbi:MAG: Ig-like domain-containing protein [Leucothrix sp.]